jgi:hypothetical protein
MPIHVDHAESHVAILDRDLPFTEAQLDKLAARVAARMAEQQGCERSKQGVPRRSIVRPIEARRS